MNKKYRTLRLSEIIREELSEIILKFIDYKPGALVTLTGVEISDDALDANVWISIFPPEDAKEISVVLEKASEYLQHLLNERLKMKRAPKLHFRLDKGIEEAARIEKLLENSEKN